MTFGFGFGDLVKTRHGVGRICGDRMNGMYDVDLLAGGMTIRCLYPEEMEMVNRACMEHDCPNLAAEPEGLLCRFHLIIHQSMKNMEVMAKAAEGFLSKEGGVM